MGQQIREGGWQNIHLYVTIIIEEELLWTCAFSWYKLLLGVKFAATKKCTKHSRVYKTNVKC